MSRFTLALLLAALTLVAPAVASDAEPAAGATVLGQGVGDAPRVAILDLLSDPERYVGQRVRVEGRIGDVCPRRGCWIDIQSEQGKASVRYKVEDGVIVFPVEAKGKRVEAEGTLTARRMTHEQAVAHARYLAEEKGEPFDETKVTGPLTVYQIQGAGAVVHEE
jgi:hypothetical protein